MNIGSNKNKLIKNYNSIYKNGNKKDYFLIKKKKN